MKGSRSLLYFLATNLFCLFLANGCDSSEKLHKITFMPPDNERAAWIQKAKVSKNVDIGGEIKMINGKPDNEPIPKKDIDAFIKTHDQIIIILRMKEIPNRPPNVDEIK